MMSMYLLEKKRVEIVKAEPEQKWNDGSTMLQTQPTLVVVAKTEVPKGDKVVNSSSITLTKETTPSNQPNNQTPTTTLPSIPPINEEITTVQEKSGQERIIIKAPGYQVNGSEEVMSKEIEVPTYKKEILPMYGYDFNKMKPVYGIQFLYHPLPNVGIGTGIIGQTFFVSAGIRW